MSGDISFKENPSRKSYIENKTLPLTYKGTLQQLGDIIKKKTNSENVSNPLSRSFERRICAQSQDLQIFKKLTYMAGHSL